MQKESSVLSFRRLVISDIQKTINRKMIEIFLKDIRYIDRIRSFRKESDKIYLEFNGEEDGRQFIEEHNHKTQILVRKFNIYPTFFEEELIQVKRFQVNGITEDKLRKTYLFCKSKGPCRFRLQYEGNKLSHNCRIEFVDKQKNIDVEVLKSGLDELGLKIRSEEQFGDFDNFRCSIQLSHFYSVKKLELDNEDWQFMVEKLQELVKQATDEPLCGVEIQTFPHRQTYSVKAYFMFKTVQLTFSEFQKLRKMLIDKGQIQCRLFFFKDEANSFRTLFVKGIVNNDQIPQKVLEDQLLQAFRKINKNVVQIVLKGQYGTLSGKIYLKDQESGKQFLVQYTSHRQHFFQFFKPNTYVTINIFQSNQQQRKQEKWEKNTNKMISHLKKSKANNPQGPFHQPQPYFAPPIQYQPPSYPQNQKESRKRAPRYRQKVEEPLKEVKKQEKEKVKLSQDDFPSME